MPGTPPRIFISYSRTDSEFVDRLETSLQQRGFSTWVDRRGLQGGQDWLDQIQEAIDQCQVVLVALSPEAVQSKYVRMEYRYAQGQDKPVIPLEYQPLKTVPIDLHSIQRIIFHNNYDQGLQNLLSTLGRISALASPPPEVEAPQAHVQTSNTYQAPSASKANQSTLPAHMPDSPIAPPGLEAGNSQVSAQPEPTALLSARALEEAYNAVVRYHITDIATIQRIISQFEAIAADPELSQEVPFDAAAGARYLTNHLYHLQMRRLSALAQQGGDTSYPSDDAPILPDEED